ncbi:MAG: UDP binding domain-containing protein [Pseudonocardia sp.]
MRDSPSLAVAALLRQAGAELVGYDPAVPAGSSAPELAGIEVVDDPAVLAKNADALVVLTEWPEFRTLAWSDLAQVVAQPVVVDTRNILDADVLRRAGFTVHALGRA